MGKNGCALYYSRVCFAPRESLETGMTYMEDESPELIARFDNLRKAQDELDKHVSDAWITNGHAGKLLSVEEWYIVETAYDEDAEEWEIGDAVAWSAWPDEINLGAYGYWARGEDGEMHRTFNKDEFDMMLFDWQGDNAELCEELIFDDVKFDDTVNFGKILGWVACAHDETTNYILIANRYGNIELHSLSRRQ